MATQQSTPLRRICATQARAEPAPRGPGIDPGFRGRWLGTREAASGSFVFRREGQAPPPSRAGVATLDVSEDGEARVAFPGASDAPVVVKTLDWTSGTSERLMGAIGDGRFLYVLEAEDAGTLRLSRLP
jgi:hypothetical protein